MTSRPLQPHLMTQVYTCFKLFDGVFYRGTTLEQWLPEAMRKYYLVSKTTQDPSPCDGRVLVFPVGIGIPMAH